MRAYHVYWKDILVGKLEVENGKHRYIVDNNVISSLSNEPINPVLLKSQELGDPIPLFSLRINLADKFNKNEINLQTDFITLKEIK